MNFIDQVYVTLVYVRSELYKHLHIIMGALLAKTISFLKSKGGKKQNCVNGRKYRRIVQLKSKTVIFGFNGDSILPTPPNISVLN